MQLHRISQDLACMTKPLSWEPCGDFVEADITKKRYEAAVELKNSPLGRELRTRGGADVFDTVLQEFATRVRPPTISPFFESLVQAARDVLVTLPVKDPAETGPVDSGPGAEERRTEALAEQDAKRDERTKHLRKFAHMVNAALAYEGPKCLKPRDGFIRLTFKENGKPYEYEYKYGNGTGERDYNGNLITSDEYNNFMRDFEEATAKGLIR